MHQREQQRNDSKRSSFRPPAGAAAENGDPEQEAGCQERRLFGEQRERILARRFVQQRHVP